MSSPFDRACGEASAESSEKTGIMEQTEISQGFFVCSVGCGLFRSQTENGIRSNGCEVRSTAAQFGAQIFRLLFGEGAIYDSIST